MQQALFSGPENKARNKQIRIPAIMPTGSRQVKRSLRGDQCYGDTVHGGRY